MIQSPTIPTMKNPYPANDLKVTLSHVARLAEAKRQSFPTRGALLDSLGFSEGSGAGNNIISSLIHFGLLERNGRNYELSKLAKRLAATPSASSEWHDLAITALTQPELFAKLHSRFGLTGLPSNIDVILTRGYKVKATAAEKVVRNYNVSTKYILNKKNVPEQPLEAIFRPNDLANADRLDNSPVEVNFGDGLVISVPKRLVLEAYLKELEKKGWISR